MLINVLDGLAGRLSVIIREELGVAYSVGAYQDTQLDGGSLILYVQSEAKNLQKCRDVMWKEIEKLRKEPVPEADLSGVKQYLVGQEAIRVQDQGGLALSLTLSQLYETGVASVFDKPERFRSVTAKQAHAAAQRFFDPENWAEAVLLPTGK